MVMRPNNDTLKVIRIVLRCCQNLKTYNTCLTGTGTLNLTNLRHYSPHCFNLFTLNYESTNIIVFCHFIFLSTDKERISIAVKSIYGEVISEDDGSPPCIFEVSGEKEFVVEDNVFHLHKHEKGKLFFELVHILDIVDPVIFVEVGDNFVIY